MSLKNRLDKLEQQVQSQYVPPYVVRKREDESLQEAMARALNGHPPPPNWQFILAPAKLSRKEWEAKYSPLG